MFTGIIQEIGIVTNIREKGGKEFTIKASKILKKISYGDSIAVNGTCQTVTRYDASTFSFFSMDETLSLTNLSELNVGSPVNLESSATLSTLLGGHLVSGHVDGKGIIDSINKRQNTTVYNIKVDKSITPYIVKKGSIAIDGISLTVYDIKDNILTLAIIPTTSTETILDKKKVGDILNIETDILAKYVEKLLLNRFSNGSSATELSGKGNGGLSKDMLREHGFI